MARRWTYCARCCAKLERGEALDQDTLPGVEFTRRLRVIAPPVPARTEVRRRRGPLLQAETLVECRHYLCRLLPLKTCLQRQDARWPGAGRKAPIYPFCAGRCAQGARYRGLSDYEPGEEWRARSKSHSPKYQIYRPDLGGQRQKMRLFDLCRPEGEIPSIDRPPGTRPWLPPLPEIHEVLRVIEP